MKSEKPRAEVILNIRVIPRSPRTRVDGTRGDAILIRLAAAPVEGAANDALVACLSAILGLPRRNITIVAGDKSRDKRVKLSGIDERTALGRLLSS